MGLAENHRVNKREFISRIAVSSGHPIRVVSDVYESFFGELTAAVARGEIVVLTGLGRFYRQAHKGHKVRFGKKAVDDYAVLKFSASRSVNRRLDPRNAVSPAESLYVVEDDELLDLQDHRLLSVS